MASAKRFLLFVLSGMLVSLTGEQCVNAGEKSTSPELSPSEQESEFMLGNLESAIMLQGSTLLVAPELEEQVRSVLSKLSPVADFTLPTRVFIINSPVANAWACPNGDVLITTGLLTLAENVDELAVILGHELAHLKHHDGYAKTLNAFSGGKTVRRVAPVVITAVAAAGASTTGVLMGTMSISNDVTRSLYHMVGVRIMSDLTGRLIMHAGTGVAEDMVVSQVSRYSQEKEAAADLTGVRYASQAGYDAKRGSTILSRLRDLEVQATSNK